MYYAIVQLQREPLSLLLPCKGVGAHQMTDHLLPLMCSLQRTVAFQDVDHREEAKIQRPTAEASVAKVLPGEVRYLCLDSKRAKPLY